MSSVILRNNKNIETGLDIYSNIKSEIGFPSGSKISTTPNGNIVLKWSEKEEKKDKD